MEESRMEILKMIAERTITAEEGAELLKAIDITDKQDSEFDAAIREARGIAVTAVAGDDFDIAASGSEGTNGEAGQKGKKKRPRFLVIQVMDGDKKKVNVKIPLKLARIASRFIPKSAHAAMKAKGVDMDFNQLFDGLEEVGMEEDIVNVVDEEKGQRVRIFCC